MKNKTKIISAISGAALLLNSVAPAMALGLSNSVTPRDVSEISDCSELQSIKDDPAGNYVLIDDVDCSTFGTLGINSFEGVLDGKGHTISGLSEPNLVYENNGKIKNIVVENSTFSGSDRPGLVGLNIGEISNVGVKGVTVNGSNEVGALVGLNADISKIINSYAKDVNVTGYEDVGGLIGRNYGIVENSYATGIVSANEYAGGLIGSGRDFGQFKIKNAYADVDVTGQTSGRIIGDVFNITSDNFENVWAMKEMPPGDSSSENLITQEASEAQLETSSWYLDDLGFENGEEAWYLIAPNEAERAIPTPKLPNPQLSMEIDRGTGIPGTPAKPEDPSNPGDGNGGSNDSNGNGTINGDDVVYGQGQLVSTANVMLPMLATAAAGLALNNKKRK